MLSRLFLCAAALLLSPLVRAEEPKLETVTLRNAAGMEAKILNWGATLMSLTAPDREGKMGEVTLGFDDPSRYQQPHPFFGSIAGRYANRIALGKFSLEGKEYQLATNNGPNHLHGGKRGFDKRFWKMEPLGDSSVRCSYTSPDGEEGYPGTLRISVTYSLTVTMRLQIEYEATTDRPTVLNLTNHTYWNLAGDGDVLSHRVMISAQSYNVVDAGLIPTGEINTVHGTPLNFLVGKAIGRDIAALQAEGQPGGYDHNFIVNEKNTGKMTVAANVYEPTTGRVMLVMTTEPAVQFYTGNGLKDIVGRNGATYGRYAGFCLETQHYPDSPNHAEFPSTVLRPGETYRSTTVYEFRTRKQ